MINIRKQLAEAKMSQIGALNIQYQLKTLGEREISQIWTTNRILKRNHLVMPREKRYQYKGKSYPAFPDNPLRLQVLHQFDIVDPRYIKGNGCFFVHNLMDIGSHQVAIHPKRTKTH